MDLATRVASSVIHRGLDSFVNWTAVNMAAITAAAFTSRPSSVLQAWHWTTTLRVFWPRLFKPVTRPWWQQLVWLERYSEPITSGMCRATAFCIFWLGAASCSFEVGPKPPLPQTTKVYVGERPPRRSVLSCWTTRWECVYSVAEMRPRYREVKTVGTPSREKK